MPSYVNEVCSKLPFDYLDLHFIEKHTEAVFRKAASYLCKIYSRTLFTIPTQGLSFYLLRSISASIRFHNELIHQTDTLVKAYRINQIWNNIWYRLI